MNYLAHAYLSFNHPEILVGNMISDYVKGRKKFDLPPGVQKGIALHRDIDQFTDDHPVNKKAKELFRNVYRLYAGAFIDVIYDHFLATDKEQFAEPKILEVFTKQTYDQLKASYEVLPQPFQHMLPHMISHNWLYNYQYQWGLERSLEGLRRRALYIHESSSAVEIFNSNKDFLRECYNEFFP